MEWNPLFSTYRGGENRVTSSMLAVFERIDLHLVESVLATATGESTLQMVSFTNQPPGAGASIPDARIFGKFSYWFEVKTQRESVSQDQLARHLVALDRSGADERLFVITPDPEQPGAIEKIGDARLVWISFAKLSDSIDGTLNDQSVVVPEQSRFLLRELQSLFAAEGLLAVEDVVVVAARAAYPEYLEFGAYVCQPGRSFRTGLTHMGFYADGEIKPEVARILGHRDNVIVSETELVRLRQSGDAFDKLVAETVPRPPRDSFNEYQIFWLSRPDDDATVKLSRPIRNDQVAATGRTVAWTQGQRYISLERLSRPGVSKTSDLS